MRLSFWPALLTLLPLAPLAPAAQAADLVTLYRAAEQHDAQFAAARSLLDAGREKLPQGRAGLLPSISASANTTWNSNDVTLRSSGIAVSPSYNSNGWSVSLSQPLWRWQNRLQYSQAQHQVTQAEARFAQARQDLLLRVAQAYFDVLHAEDTLQAVTATQAAIAQQLASAQKNFEVGTATITDTHEAQARADLVAAQEIAARNDLEVKRHALHSLTGQAPGVLAVLPVGVSLQPPQPADMTRWVTSAETGAIAVQEQEAASAIAALEVEKQHAGHYPNVDLVATRGYAKSLSSVSVGATETDFAQIGIQVSIPLYSGGATSSREREAVANRSAALSSLEAARRNAAQVSRQAYLGVASGLAQIRALEAALTSSQSALASNKLGYEVGVRINIDVLNAEQQVFATRRDLSRARFDTLLAQLRLKAAVGSLGEEDLRQINALFTTP